MSASVAETRMNARRAIHARFAVACAYLPPGTGTTSIPLTVRRQNRSVINGKGEGTGYATLQEGYSRLVFNGEELTTAGVVLRRGGKVTLTDEGTSYILFAVEPSDGPVNVSWIATEPPRSD